MRFCYGLPAIEEYKLVSPQKLSYNLIKLHIYGIVVGSFVILPLAYLCWRTKWSQKEILSVLDKGDFFQFLAILVFVTIGHEICHLIAHPLHGASRDSFLGFEPKSGLPYVTYNGPMSRSRFIVTAFAPLMIISCGAAICAFFYPSWVSQLAIASIYNACASVGDMYIVILVLRTVPSGAFIQREYYGDLSLAAHSAQDATNQRDLST